MREMRQIRCGVQGCNWVLPATGTLCWKAAVAGFMEWRTHLVECHGLKPDMKELGDLKDARLYFDLDEGDPSWLTILAMKPEQMPEYMRRAAKAWLN
jgi:hypothetical protein